MDRSMASTPNLRMLGEFSRHGVLLNSRVQASDSSVGITLEKVPNGTLLTLKHWNIPDGRAEGYESCWQDFYFTQMQENFRTSQICSRRVIPLKNRLWLRLRGHATDLSVSSVTSRFLRLRFAPEVSRIAVLPSLHLRASSSWHELPHQG